MARDPIDEHEAQARAASANMVAQQLRPRGIHDPAVLRAMAQVPRHLFVPRASVEDAYGDHALPTAEGQTISQPYMVALMTQLLQVEAGARVLEIGTGSGYQAAILAHLGARVVSVERSRWLGHDAQRVLERLGFDANIVFVVGDGTLGYPPGAPYDRIIVTAGAPYLPQALADQLGPRGRIVIPVGDRDEQQLMVYIREGDKFREEGSVACRFVPLIGKDGWQGG